MGIARGFTRLLLDELKIDPPGHSVLQLGRQGIFLTGSELKGVMQDHGFDTTAVKENDSRMNDIEFFSSLGFQNIESCDYSDFQSATHIFDLNLPAPEHLKEKYDLIIDGGTMEHVFDIPQVLKNIHHMLKPEGRIIHLAPSSNYVDHGFYMFSPTLFFDYYHSNNWSGLRGKIIQHTQGHHSDPWYIYEYEPGSIEHLSYGGFDNGKLTGFFFSATKNLDTVSDQIPQQGKYIKNHWKTKDSQMIHKENVEVQRIQVIKNLIYRFPLFYKTLSKISRLLPRKRKMPKLIGKY